MELTDEQLVATMRAHLYEGDGGYLCTVHPKLLAEAGRAAIRLHQSPPGALTSKDDQILRSSVPDRWKTCTSPIGAVQSYIAELEMALERYDLDWSDNLALEDSSETNIHGLSQEFKPKTVFVRSVEEYRSALQQLDEKRSVLMIANVNYHSDIPDGIADRLLNTPIPGGSTAKDWFLPHESEKAKSNVRDVMKSALFEFIKYLKGK